MSEHQAPLVVGIGSVIAFLAMCYAGILRSKGQKLPWNLSQQTWAYMSAGLLVVPWMVAGAVGLFQEQTPAGVWIIVVPIWAIGFFLGALYQYWGALIIARGIIAGRNLFGHSSEISESKKSCV